MTRQKGQSVAYTYDNLHRLTTVTVGGGNYTYGYVAASPLVQSLTRPNGAVTAYQYDGLNRLTQATTQVGGVTLNQYAYTYNQQDLRAGEAAVEPEPPAPYADELVNYAYNNVNELTTMSDPGEKPLTYDASGNLTQGYTPEGYVFTATYDGLNRLGTLSYTDGGGVVNRTDFFYVGNLLLKKKRYQNGSLTQESRYVYDGLLPVQERDGNNNVLREYTYGLGLPGGIGGLLHLNQSGAPYSYTYDGKGNVTAPLDGIANVAAVYQYDPFGVPRGPANTLSQPMQFSTKPYDEKTGLSYYGYRFYASALGRWMTRDPLGERGGINLYGFTDNNPVNFVDPFGLVKGCGCAKVAKDVGQGVLDPSVSPNEIIGTAIGGALGGMAGFIIHPTPWGVGIGIGVGGWAGGKYAKSFADPAYGQLNPNEPTNLTGNPPELWPVPSQYDLSPTGPAPFGKCRPSPN